MKRTSSGTGRFHPSNWRRSVRGRMAAGCGGWWTNWGWRRAGCWSGISEWIRVTIWRTIFCIRPDRKSTRVNSSHLGISYAVFCLKKKQPREAEEAEAREQRPAAPLHHEGEPHDAVGHRVVFFFNDTATTEIYTLSLHDALPI